MCALDHNIELAPKRCARDGAPVLTGGGNLICDANCVAHIPAGLADDTKRVTGVVEHGLFLDLAEEARGGTDAGV